MFQNETNHATGAGFRKLQVSVISGCLVLCATSHCVTAQAAGYKPAVSATAKPQTEGTQVANGAAANPTAAANANRPTVFQNLVRQPEQPKEKQDNSNNSQQMAQFLQQLAGMNGGNFGGTQAQGKNSGRGGQSTGSVGPGNPTLVPCNSGGLPAHVQKAIQEAMDFRGRCPTAAKSEGKHIAINDYSLESGSQPTMYIFSLDGKCEKQTSITWGRGENNEAMNKPMACADGGSNFTPPGFHLTSKHLGGDYNDTNSLLLVALEKQQSGGRKILIHGAEAPGTASSLGCTGVGQECLNDVRSMLGYGSLVYNYFGSNENNPECSSQAGKSSNRNAESCYPEQKIAEGTPSGLGSPATTN